VEGINRASWQFLAFWGVAGIGLGSLLPWVDALWEWHETSDVENSQQSQMAEGEAEEGKTTDWSIVVRSIGAFVGIAFAIVSHAFLPRYFFDLFKANVRSSASYTGNLPSSYQ